MRRNASIDHLKFIFSLVILLYHFGMYFFGGYIVVEGFFMITGYLMMTSLMKRREEGVLPPDSTAKFVLHKYSAVFLPLLFSAISGTLVYEKLVYKNPTEITVQKLPLLLFEIFPVQIAGYAGFWTTGVSWYLASMLLSIALLHPFAKKDPMRFAYTGAPVIAILGYGLLCQHMHMLDVPNSWIEGLINTGLLRGMAGISGGCVLYALVNRSKERVSMGMRILCTVAELAGFWHLCKVIMNEEEVRGVKDFLLTAVIFGILYVALSGKTLFSLIPANRISRGLATVSTYVFMNHYYWCRFFATNYPDKERRELFGWFVLCVAASSVTVWLLTKLTELVIKKVKEKKKRVEATEAV